MSAPVAPTTSGSGTELADRRILTIARVLAVGLVVVACLRIAWIGDDALITLRTALNITHGWGPGFNATESVQAYTHPLWFLAWTGLGAATSQWILGILALSLALTGVAVGLVAWRTRTLARLIVVAALLVFSTAFVEYATSGLENPLAYAMVGTLIALTLPTSALHDRHRLGWAVLVGLTGAAVVLTRMDLAVLVLPIAVVLVVRERRDLRVLALMLAAAALPLGAWFAWSRLTYDAWLPNTFAAKRNLHIPLTEIIVQGFRYLWVTFETDPVTLGAIVLGLAAALALGRRETRTWAVGVCLYIGYVVWIGGDFMVGRFLAVPVFVAVFLLAVVEPSPELPRGGSVADPWLTTAAVGFVLVLMVGAFLAGSTPMALSAATTERWTVDWNTKGGIADERGFWGPDRALSNIVFNLALGYTNPDFVGPSTGASMGRSLREIDKSAKNWPRTDSYVGLPDDVAVFCGGLGQAGIASGPRVHLVDDCGLTDRFLAERPFTSQDFQWRIGDFHRAVPDGYLDAIHADNPGLMKDPADAAALARLWKSIRPPSS